MDSAHLIHVLPVSTKNLSLFLTNDKQIAISSATLISKLLVTKLPHKNKQKALRNIFDFLAWCDTRMNDEHSTILKINQETLIDFFSRNSYVQYMQLFKELGVMSKVSYADNTFYKIGEYSLQYRFFNDYVNDVPCIVIMESQNREREYSIDYKVNIKFENTILRTQIDLPGAIEAELDYYEKESHSILKFRSRLHKICSLDRKRFIKKGYQVDRIYHSFSNISKISREFLSVSGMKFNNIDIVNCQPTLLCAYLKEKNYEIDESYVKDCENGTFYERFYDLSHKDEVRSDIKVRLYKSIFFSFKKTKINLRFKELYPLTYKSIETIANGSTIARALQNYEASIFNDLVPVYSKYYFTLFDAIYYTDSRDYETLRALLLSKFEKLDMSVSLSSSSIKQ